MQMPLGWWTDVEVARRSGSIVQHREDRHVVRTPANPTFHWGNFVLVSGNLTPADARDAFKAEFPESGHLAVGLLARPDPDIWAGVPLEVNEVRASRQPPVGPPVAGYTVRPLQGSDWRAAWELETQGMPLDYADFAWRRIESRQRLTRAGDGVFIGCFDGEELVADLGIVMCGQVARFQSVMTAPGHRGRGLASWLLAVAGDWAQKRGAGQWVILCDPNTAAARLYDHLGFALVEHSVQWEVAEQGSR